MNDFFQTNLMTLKHSDGTQVKQHLPCQMDTVNIPMNMEDQGMIPTDWYDLYSLGWISPVPVRGDVFVDETTNNKYSVFGNPAVYTDHLEVRVSIPLGDTP
jgi:hypothetical protein